MWRLLPVLLAASCGGDPDVIAIRPTLRCEHKVSCHTFYWRLGTAYTPNLGGVHLWCRCVSPAEER